MSRGAEPKGWEPPREPARQVRAETQTQLIPIDFRRGLDQSQESTMLPSGFATKLINWVPEPVGGLRCRPAWNDWLNGREGNDGDNHSKPFPASGRKCRGIRYVNLTDGPGDPNGGIWWAVSLYNPDATPADQVQLWVSRVNRTQSWYHIQDVNATNIDNYPLSIQVVARKKADGGAAMLWVHPSMQRVNYWLGDIPATTYNIPDTDFAGPKTQARPGRALGYHKTRVFMGGSDPNLDNVTYRLYYSDFDVDGFPDFTSWPDKNFIDVGKEDGEQISCLQSFQGVLFVGKPGGVFMLQGSDVTTFNLTELAGTSASKGRSLVATPTGMVFLGLHDAWFWAGGDPQRISSPVQDDYEAGAALPRFGAYCNGKVYVSSFVPTVPMLVFDVTSGVWTTEDIGSEDEHLMAVDSYNARLVGVPHESDLVPPMVYRDHPTGGRGKDPWNTIGVTYQARSADTWLTHERALVTLRQLWIRTRRRGTLNVVKPNVIVRVDGVVHKTYPVDVATADGGVEWARIPLDGAQARAVGFEIIQTPDHTNGTVFDIEDALAEVQIEQWR